MRPFITVAALVAVATSDALDGLVQALTSWERPTDAGPPAKSPGVLAFLKREASRDAAYRLQDGGYCRELVGRVGELFCLVPSKKRITCLPGECQTEFERLRPINNPNTKFDARCLVPQRALITEARAAVGGRFARESKWRPVHGSDEYVRLEVPGSGMPCVRGKCSGQSQCQDTPEGIPMCTDLGEREPSRLSVTDIFSAVSDHTDTTSEKGKRWFAEMNKIDKIDKIEEVSSEKVE